MKILKDDVIIKNMIIEIRNAIKSDTNEAKKFLGINSNNIASVIPIKNRDFHIWVLFSNDNKINGFLSFMDKTDDIKFIKLFYIFPKYRKQGFGRFFIKRFYENYSKLECKINQGNNIMYHLVESIGMHGEKSVSSKLKPLNTKPVWWSNY